MFGVGSSIIQRMFQLTSYISFVARAASQKSKVATGMIRAGSGSV